VRPTILLILDGFGLSSNKTGNAIELAKKPNLDFLFKNYPWGKLLASGSAVGLPEGQMGNSEVGHINIGAGRIIYQELTRISKSIHDGDFFENPAFMRAVNNTKKNKSALHIFGLLSDGGVHSHIEHLFALLELAKKNNLEKVYTHAFLDGRDTSPNSGLDFINSLEKKIKKLGVGKLASVMGRYYAMDRDNRWDRINKAYNILVNPIGNQTDNICEYIKQSYKNNITDEFIEPVIINNSQRIKNHDSIIFFNFRPDRARQITRAFCEKDFQEFSRDFLDLIFVCFTNYDIKILNKLVAYEKELIINTLGEYISSLGLRQLRLAETEKYAHVTFFFNGGIETPNKNEDRILVPSPKVATYDLKPEMSAFEITDQLVSNANKYDLVITNFANSDMVGHTGNLNAAISSIQAIDTCMKKIYEFILKNNIKLVICADHGNSEQMIDTQTHNIFTAHTTNPVPFLLINTGLPNNMQIKSGKLCDIAPTILKLMNLKQPSEMTGISLI